ncbi:hypothetical protein VC83_00935 [Pseudogymnoascus destructans]|uniref:RING-type domain-containing protein n=2 Tax=Pseudogymnoascus destructans TaxID=655981 RepID=L8FMK4_PSED2|nr:uncharacterized protein VC83_00935 [Pseudogymnoascus destructans]ELR01703.1 hypothetical protein GMDG_00079 [Pseudogymnoascus destructans 20631-21]OAF62269.1 hypothetical protein VC83_00935 [Pseudogymnoascus destructans]
MAIHALIVLLLTSMAGAVDVFGTDAPLSKQATQLTLVWESPQGTLTPLLEPLTAQAGRGGSIRASTNIQGSFKSVTTNGAGAGEVNKGDIALVSCDSTNSSFLTQDAVIDLIVPKNPGAIVLYSVASAHCGVKDVGSFANYYTLRNVTGNAMQMLASTTSANATIQPDTAQAENQPTSRNQSPAVAMSVLYAVTGIVTVLFLIIITTGAWRAHNNPARYGPRTGFAGRPRQSRAKGLAKAMLETLPIVKFGDPLPPKAENRDIELDNTNASEEPNAVHVATDSPQQDAIPVAADIATSSPKSNEVGSSSQPNLETLDEHLGCSICTEDFTKGEDVRVLPCNHQYHPACIDPWLLNVSGTCPLCRVDLRPVRSNLSASEPSSPTDADQMPAVPAETVHQSRVQRILATRHAPVHERMAILRQLARESGQHQPTEPDSPAAPADGSRNRLSLADRLRDRFSVCTRSSNAHDETSAPTTSVTETTANTTTTRSSGPDANATSEEAPPRP